jgi:SAM-dependent methyltransferase
MKNISPIKSITNIYSKMSNFGKILLFIALLLITVVFFKSIQIPGINKEGFMTTPDKFLFKTGNDVYDDFYANIYDYLVFNNIKNSYEIGEIVNSTSPSETSIILDVGCGTGHHVGTMSEQNLNVLGIDISPSMIQKAKENYPNLNFRVGNALNTTEFKYQTFTHILCLYFTIYYFPDKRRFFDNCMDWLMPGGYLVVHLVDREKFDPILPPGNPLYIVSPQKYAKQRITTTKVTFNDFVYNSDFKFNKDENIATFDEKFKFNDGTVRKQEQKLYMEDEQDILTIAQQCGFILQGKIDLVKCAYENQYLYILMKPS